MTLDLALARASVHADEKSKKSLKDPIQSENGGAHLPEFTEVGRALDLGRFLSKLTCTKM